MKVIAISRYKSVFESDRKVFSGEKTGPGIEFPREAKKESEFPDEGARGTFPGRLFAKFFSIAFCFKWGRWEKEVNTHARRRNCLYIISASYDSILFGQTEGKKKKNQNDLSNSDPGPMAQVPFR